MVGMFLNRLNIAMGGLNGFLLQQDKPLPRKTLYTYASISSTLLSFHALSNTERHLLPKTILPTFLGVGLLVGAQLCMGIQLGKAFSQVLE
jgi:hypothetical protein